MIMHASVTANIFFADTSVVIFRWHLFVFRWCGLGSCPEQIFCPSSLVFENVEKSVPFYLLWLYVFLFLRYVFLRYNSTFRSGYAKSFELVGTKMYEVCL